MARGYSMANRGVAAGATRARIVEAGRELLLAGDFGRVTMGEVAQRAEVARATVYQHVSSKSGLVGAVVDDHEERTGVAGLPAVIESTRTEDLVPTVVGAWVGCWAADPELIRTALALGRLQPDLRVLLAGHDDARLATLTTVVDRLVAERRLAAGCRPKAALDALWLATSFEAYDVLTRRRDLSRAKAARSLTRLAQARLAAAD